LTWITGAFDYFVMKDRYFKSSVTIEPRLGRFREAATVAQAALFLIREWPATRGEKYRASLQACLDVLDGKKLPYRARKAFVAAAREANILSDEGHAEGPEPSKAAGARKRTIRCNEAA
jgi:hypothetical protein